MALDNFSTMYLCSPCSVLVNNVMSIYLHVHNKTVFTIVVF